MIRTQDFIRFIISVILGIIEIIQFCIFHAIPFIIKMTYVLFLIFMPFVPFVMIFSIIKPITFAEVTGMHVFGILWFVVLFLINAVLYCWGEEYPDDDSIGIAKFKRYSNQIYCTTLVFLVIYFSVWWVRATSMALRGDIMQIDLALGFIERIFGDFSWQYIARMASIFTVISVIFANLFSYNLCKKYKIPFKLSYTKTRDYFSVFVELLSTVMFLGVLTIYRFVNLPPFFYIMFPILLAFWILFKQLQTDYVFFENPILDLAKVFTLNKGIKKNIFGLILFLTMIVYLLVVWVLISYGSVNLIGMNLVDNFYTSISNNKFGYTIGIMSFVHYLFSFLSVFLKFVNKNLVGKMLGECEDFFIIKSNSKDDVRDENLYLAIIRTNNNEWICVKCEIVESKKSVFEKKSIKNLKINVGNVKEWMIESILHPISKLKKCYKNFISLKENFASLCETGQYTVGTIKFDKSETIIKTVGDNCFLINIPYKDYDIIENENKKIEPNGIIA